MSNRKDTYQIYERADIIPINTPKRTLLFEVSPINVNTENVESFTGYLNRIAYKHCASHIQLLKFCLFKSEKVWNKKLIYCSRRLNGLNRDAELAVGILKEAILKDEIRFTNLLPLRDVISVDQLIKTKGFWCPACLDDDLKNNGTAYERLIWNLEINKVCSIHQTRLFDRCPYCSKSSTSKESSVYGYCPTCKKWLGDSLKKHTVYKDARNFKSRSIWIEKELRNLLKHLPIAEDIFSKEKLSDAFFHLVLNQTEGNITLFCRKFGLMETDLLNLFLKKNAISLRNLMTVCYCMNISLVDLLKGEIPSGLKKTPVTESKGEHNLANEYFQLFVDYDLNKTRIISKEKIERARVIMVGLINEKPISFSKVCEIVGIKERILKRALPFLSLELKNRSKYSHGQYGGSYIVY